MDAALLDVLHDSADDALLAVAERVNVDLGRIGEEAVKEDRRLVGDDYGLLEVAAQVGLVIDDFHGAAAEDIGGSYHQRIGDAVCDLHSLLDGGCGAVLRLQEVEALYGLLEALSVLGAVNRVRAGADDGHAGSLKCSRELERGLSAELDDYSGRLLDAADLEDILKGYGLEIKSVRGVVVGGDGLRVAVDHDGLIAVITERESGMDAAEVELNALADSVRAAAQDDDLLPV